LLLHKLVLIELFVGKVFHFTFFLNPGTGERYSCPEALRPGTGERYSCPEALRRIATQCQGRCDTEARQKVVAGEEVQNGAEGYRAHTESLPQT